MGYQHFANPKKRRDFANQFADIAGGLGSLAQIIQNFQKIQADNRVQTAIQENQNRLRNAFNPYQALELPAKPTLNSNIATPRRNDLRDFILAARNPEIPPGTGALNPLGPQNQVMGTQTPTLPGVTEEKVTDPLSRLPNMIEMLKNSRVVDNQIPMQGQIRTDPNLIAKGQAAARYPGFSDVKDSVFSPAEQEAIAQNPANLAAILQAKKQGDQIQPDIKIGANLVMNPANNKPAYPVFINGQVAGYTPEGYIKPEKDEATSWDKVDVTPDGKVIYRNKLTGEEKTGTTTVRPEKGDKDQTFDKSTTLRNQYISITDDFRTIRDQYGVIRSANEDPSAAGDLSIIFAYMKMVDPRSVVRESEQATAQNAAGVPDRVRNIYNKILTGEKLAPEQRKDFVQMAEKIMKSQRDQYQKTRDEYSRLAESFGLDPAQVLVDIDFGTGSERIDEQGKKELEIYKQKFESQGYSLQEMFNLIDKNKEQLIKEGTDPDILKRYLRKNVK